MTKDALPPVHLGREHLSITICAAHELWRAMNAFDRSMAGRDTRFMRCGPGSGVSHDPFGRLLDSAHELDCCLNPNRAAWFAGRQFMSEAMRGWPSYVEGVEKDAPSNVFHAFNDLYRGLDHVIERLRVPGLCEDKGYRWLYRGEEFAHWHPGTFGSKELAFEEIIVPAWPASFRWPFLSRDVDPHRVGRVGPVDYCISLAVSTLQAALRGNEMRVLEDSAGERAPKGDVSRRTPFRASANYESQGVRFGGMSRLQDVPEGTRPLRITELPKGFDAAAGEEPIKWAIDAALTELFRLRFGSQEPRYNVISKNHLMDVTGFRYFPDVREYLIEENYIGEEVKGELCEIREQNGQREIITRHEPAYRILTRVLNERLPDARGTGEKVAVLAGPSENTAPSTKSKITKDEANRRAIAWLEKHPHGTAREVADAVGCSLGLVDKLPAWKAVSAARKQGKTRKRRRAVALTDKVLAQEPQDDEALRRLTDEQKVDWDPSPLDDDPPDRPPQRVREHKHV